MTGIKRGLLAALLVVGTGAAGMLMYQRASAEHGYAVARVDLEAGKVITPDDVIRVSGRWPSGPVRWADAQALVGRRLLHPLVEGQPFFASNIVFVQDPHPPALEKKWRPPGGSAPPAPGDRFHVRWCSPISVTFEPLLDEAAGGATYEMERCFSPSAGENEPWPPHLDVTPADPLLVTVVNASPPDEGGNYTLTFHLPLILHDRVRLAQLVRESTGDVS